MIDWRRLGQAVLVQACRDAERDDGVGTEARDWLTRPVCGLRESIVDAATDLTQDDLNRLVVRYGRSTRMDR